jgi:type VI secretion system protein ImpG
LSFNKYYQDELSFLREMGKEFAHAHPEAAHFLAEGGSDPDVERLLEGFAFLTGRIRQKIDDELPEATHTLVSLLLPQYLRPIPPISMLEFESIRGIVRKPCRIPRGTEVASVPVDGTSCHFRTCYDVDLYPFSLESAAIKTPDGGRTELQLRFVMEPGCSISWREISKLRFFLAGESAEMLYYWLCRHVEQIRVRSNNGPKSADGFYIEKESVQPAGFGREEALFPYPRTAFDGYRLIQEYFTFPEKFLFVDLTGLESLKQGTISNAFEIDFIFSRFVNSALKVSNENVRLFCSPVVNLASVESEPLRVDHERTEYRVRPAVPNPNHFEIYSIDRASGWIQGSAEELEYLPLFSFKFEKADPLRKKVFYHTQLRSAVVGDGTDVYVSFVDTNYEEALPPTETVAFQLTCTNRVLAEKLRPGDIHAVTENTPAIARFRNITRVSPGIRPPLNGDLYWRLMSHLALNYVSLASAPIFREILGLYNFQSLENRQAGRANQFRIEGILDVQSTPEHLLFKGVPVQGMTTHIALRESHFNSDGDMFLFGSILDEFLSLYVTLNSFSRLIVRGVDKGDIYKWPPRIGRQIIL